jgi:tRNA(Ile)-lysidine synthase TilS/MesJ
MPTLHLPMPSSSGQSAIPIAARRHPLVAEVRRQAAVRCAWDANGSLVVGVSGGADSLALLIACEVVRQGALTAVHVHHHLRPEADADA